MPEVSFMGAVFPAYTADYRDLGPCLKGSLFLDGKGVSSVDNSCDRDNTVYRDISFHTIDSMVHHTSPSLDELNAATENGVTPSLPVDMTRAVEFVSPMGAAVMLRYPNFFTLPMDVSVDELKAFIKNDLDNQWNWMNYKDGTTGIKNDEIRIAKEYLDAGTMDSPGQIAMNIKTDENFKDEDVFQFAAYACDSTGEDIKDIGGRSVCHDDKPVQPVDSSVCNGDYDNNIPSCRVTSSSEGLKVEKYAQSRKSVGGGWFSGHVGFYSGSLLFAEPVFEKDEPWQYMIRYQRTKDLDKTLGDMMFKFTLPANATLSGYVDKDT